LICYISLAALHSKIEMFVRWFHKTFDLVQITIFITIFDHNGISKVYFFMINVIFVIYSYCETIKNWKLCLITSITKVWVFLIWLANLTFVLRLVKPAVIIVYNLWLWLINCTIWPCPEVKKTDKSYIYFNKQYFCQY